MSQCNPAYNWCVKQGDTNWLGLNLTEDDGTPIDVTTASVEFSVALSPGRKPAWTWTDDTVAWVNNNKEYDVEVLLSPNVTREFGELTRLVYELTLTMPQAEGEPWRLTVLEGTLDVTPEVWHEP